jgi:hypothetical protein
MKISQLPLAEATPAQVRAYATDFLQLDIEHGSSDAAVEAAVMTAQGWAGDGTEMIFVMEAAAAAPSQAGDPPPFVPGATAPRPAAPVGAMAGSLGHDDPQVTIKINNDAGRGSIGARDVPVGVNGRVWQLKRMVPVKIPYRVFLALQDAIEDEVTHDPSNNEELHTDVQRVTYQSISMPSADEIAEWHARVDATELV